MNDPLELPAPPSIYTLVVAMARHMVKGCPTCHGTGSDTTYEYDAPTKMMVPTTQNCPRCTELLTLLKQVET